MTGALKAVLWILVAVVVIGGVYYWYQNREVVPITTVPETATTTDSTAGPTLPSGSDTSDAALQQDLASIGAEMTVMDADATSIDQSLNDKPISQQ